MTIEGGIPTEIAAVPEAIRLTLAAARPAAKEAADYLQSLGTRRIFVIGNGTSYHSGLAVAALHRRHATPDDVAVVALTAADFLNYPPKLDRRDALLGISASGEFRDVIAAVERFRSQIPTIGVVHVPSSTLARAAERVVIAAGGPSTMPVMTKTFASTLVAAQLLVSETLGPLRGDAYVEDALQAAADAEAAILAADERVADIAARLAGLEHLFVVGSGLGAVAALEAALKLKEMALLHAEGTEASEMASGAATMIGHGAGVVALALDGPGRAAVVDLAVHAQRWGAHVVEVSAVQAVAGSDHLSVRVAEDQAPLAAVPPVALLAYALARRRGATPDSPGWVDRYHTQGLHHIMGASTDRHVAKVTRVSRVAVYAVFNRCVRTLRNALDS